MAIITLTTDFGEKDYFAGAIKGAIYSELPDSKIVDISHLISPFNVHECGFVIKNAYPFFPKGSIHIIGVDAERTPENKHIALRIDGHYFIGADNGILSLLTTEIKPEEMVEINIHKHIRSSFPVLEVFVQVACHLARGGALGVIGKAVDQIKELTEFHPRVSDNKNAIYGSVIYIDNYGNVVSNISQKLFKSVGKGRRYTISAREHKLDKIYNSYSELIQFDLEKSRRKGPGDLLALFNSANYIELAIYKSNVSQTGGAASLLGLHFRDTILINFE
ncbi:MAG: SAM-dependent chlorinase/fluorinase [Flavobacteriaceae bacterium]|nr:SAM-dependent chlorinase/fluorinase [Flavobacteriaceae bacterium]